MKGRKEGTIKGGEGGGGKEEVNIARKEVIREREGEGLERGEKDMRERGEGHGREGGKDTFESERGNIVIR